MDKKLVIQALVQAHCELNSIRARDGVPYDSTGYRTSVDEEYFSSVVELCKKALGELDAWDEQLSRPIIY